MHGRREPTSNLRARALPLSAPESQDGWRTRSPSVVGGLHSPKKPSENSLTAPQRPVAGDLGSFRMDSKPSPAKLPG